MLKIKCFEPNICWLGWWKYKENVSFYRLQGGKLASDKEASNWIKNVLPNLMRDYEDKDIFNTVESVMKKKKERH